MRKFCLFVTMLLCFVTISEGAVSAKAHAHCDDCYTGNKHYHTNNCKKTQTLFWDFPYPNASCKTCGGDGFVETSCNGALTYKEIMSGCENGSHVTHSYTNGSLNAGYTSCSHSLKYAGIPVSLSCGSCGEYLFVGDLCYIKLWQTNAGTFYQTLANQLAWEDTNFCPDLYAVGRHTFNRCPECIGETSVCTSCNGLYSSYNVGSGYWGEYSCPGRIVGKTVTMTLSHGYYSSGSYEPPAPHKKDFTVYIEQCNWCEDIVYATNPDGSKLNLQCTCSTSTPNGTYYYSFSDPTSFNHQMREGHQYPDNSKDISSNNNGYPTSSVAGRKCATKFRCCQYCYYGGQNQIIICGCDTYNYYDANKNITPDICNKVVNKIDCIKS